jgi:hypothetical protein
MSSGGSSEGALSRGVPLLLALFLCACAASPDRDNPSYEAGFADGCATASAENPSIPRNPQRDEALYAGDSNYRSGWISGHATCRMTEGRPRL